MSFQIEKLDNSMVKLTIEVPAEELDKAIEKAYQKEKNKISIPGFRKGKAPRAMIEKMYGKSVFYEGAVNELIPDAFAKAAEECEEEIVSRPQVDVIQVEAGKPFIFTAEVALKPEATLGEYKGIKVEKIDVTVTDEEVAAELEKVRESNCRTIDVTDRAVKDGDMTVIDFEGFVDGIAFEGGKGTDYPLTIGSGAFIPGFEAELIGAEIGKEVDVNVSFPEDYHAEDLAGKPAVFKCTVKSIKEKELPELNDELASEVSEFETLEEYKASIKEKLSAAKIDNAKSVKEDEIMEAVIANATLEIPAPMLEATQEEMINDFAQRIQSQGLSFQQYMQYTGMTIETMMEQVKPQAEKRIQSRLVLEAVAKAEKMEVTEEEFESEIKVMSEAYQIEIEKIKEMLGAKGEKQVKEDILVKKALEFLVANSKEKAASKAKKAKKEEAAEE